MDNLNIDKQILVLQEKAAHYFNLKNSKPLTKIPVKIFPFNLSKLEKEKNKINREINYKNIKILNKLSEIQNKKKNDINYLKYSFVVKVFIIPFLSFFSTFNTFFNT